jgi:hypothetical protein
MRGGQFVQQLIAFCERYNRRLYKLRENVAGADDRQSSLETVRLLDGTPVIDDQGAAAIYRDGYGRAFAATEPAAGDQLCEKRKLGRFVRGDEVKWPCTTAC